jgi:hypothetical protein
VIVPHHPRFFDLLHTQRRAVALKGRLSMIKCVAGVPAGWCGAGLGMA